MPVDDGKARRLLDKGSYAVKHKNQEENVEKKDRHAGPLRIQGAPKTYRKEKKSDNGWRR